jgi:crossover junction endodeoxyribonuclease RuvC
MFVLGIDPGLSRCGYGCVTRVSGRYTPVAGGYVTTSPGEPLHARLRTLHAELVELIRELSPAAVVVEKVFFQNNARTAMPVGQASGVALLAAAQAGCEVAEYTSNEVKLAVAGYGGAGKSQVQQMVARLLGLEAVPRPPDAADALALALCHLATAGWRAATATAAAGAGAQPRPAAAEAVR